MAFIFAVSAVFLAALAAPLVTRTTRRYSGWLLSLVPLGLFVYLATFLPRIIDGELVTGGISWVPSLGINFTFYLDGLSLLFALLVTGIGTIIVLYSGAYLASHQYLGRFYAIILMFMGSMLGLVLAGNLLVLFLFWELTSISSYLLVGFDHERESARRSALQALLVTGGGGLALLAGVVLLGLAGGGFDVADLLAQADVVQDHNLAVPAMILIFFGAFTKSAQFPFHFWLPNAMEAPTPVSAYLHSATMVKAGIYLLARTSPIFSDLDAWMYVLTAVGAVTMVTGAVKALGQDDLKRLLAYTTVSKLGILTLLIGLGNDLAIKAAMVVLLAHALYKAALFLIAGTIDHETGTRNVSQLGGLRRAMPITAATVWLAAASMASLPPFLGFIGKEKLYEAGLDSELLSFLVTGAAVLASVFLVAAAGVIAVRPFLGSVRHTPKHPHEAPVALWVGPAILAALGLIIGLAPGVILAPFLTSIVSAVLGETIKLKLVLWSGFNVVLGLTALTILAGMVIYAGRDWMSQKSRRLAVVSRIGPEAIYELGLETMNRVASWQTHVLQSGYLRRYVMLIMFATVGLVGFTLLRHGDLKWPSGSTDILVYEGGIAALIAVAAIAAATLRSRLAAITALGVTGYGVALMFIFFGAPDLAMTQILIETLTVILFVLVFYHLPPPVRLSNLNTRLRDAVVALGVGTLMAALVLVAVSVQFQPPISEFFAEASVPLAHGRNIVNVTLVDFRAFDTLGEITVLAVAAIGIFAMLKLVLGKK